MEDVAAPRGPRGRDRGPMWGKSTGPGATGLASRRSLPLISCVTFNRSESFLRLNFLSIKGPN